MDGQDMIGQNWIYTYYQQIKNGSVIVGEWITRLYELIIRNLEAKEIFFDPKKANAAIDWIEMHCRHTEGPLAPGLLKLEVWQKAALSLIFGVTDKDGRRQFREVALIVARKNGKSLFAAAVAAYEFFVDGGFGARIYCLAPKLDQADLVYNDIWAMTQLDPEYIFAYSEAGYNTIRTSSDWATLKAVSSGKVYLVPSMPHGFIDSPVCSNRIIVVVIHNITGLALACKVKGIRRVCIQMPRRTRQRGLGCQVR
jgi:hypothetical protein